MQQGKIIRYFGSVSVKSVGKYSTRQLLTFLKLNLVDAQDDLKMQSKKLETNMEDLQ